MINFYRIKQIDWFGSKKYIVQKRVFLMWKTLKNKEGYAIKFDTIKRAEVLRKYYENKEESLFQNQFISSINYR